MGSGIGGEESGSDAGDAGRRRAPRRAARGAVVGVLLGLVVAAGCTRPRPIIAQRQFAPTHGLLQTIAVMPFYPARALASQRGPKEESPWVSAALVTRFVTEALVEHGFGVVPASDLETAFRGEGQVTPRLDPRSAAATASRNFGASAVMLGELLRFRERSGGAGGSERPASVAFRVVIYSAPDARRLWAAEFDETQPSVTADLWRARQYPGRGTRWLSAAELARFGADRTARSLDESG